jgi:hypothetical protein
MKYFFSLALIGLFTSFSAQEVIYPYNPDANNDQYVAVSDVLSTISAFGSGFLPTEILINNTELTEIINQLQAAISVLQSENTSQESLLSTQNQQIEVLITAVNNLQSLWENCCGIDQDSDGIFDNEDSCVDLTACNYNANPTETCVYDDVCGVCGGDGSSCSGCTAPTSCNFDPSATIDDGSCLVCDDYNPCTIDLCEGGQCVYYNSTSTCDDGNPCTYMDMCVGGFCVGLILDCDDGDPLTYDACLEGVCVHTPMPGY